jgi:hypothetical protein
VSERLTDAEADEDTETDRSCDSAAVAHAGAVAHRVVRRANAVTVALATADGDTDAVACARITEPRPCDAGLDRFRSDDLRVRVDLAPLPELSVRAITVVRPSGGAFRGETHLLTEVNA